MRTARRVCSQVALKAQRAYICMCDMHVLAGGSMHIGCVWLRGWGAMHMHGRMMARLGGHIHICMGGRWRGWPPRTYRTCAVARRHLSVGLSVSCIVYTMGMAMGPVAVRVLYIYGDESM